MVTGNNGMDFNHILNQIPGFHASPDCQPEFPGYPGEVFPDNSFPTPELPSPDFPDNSLPSPGLPDNSLPTPDQPSDENQDEAVGAVLKLVNEERAKAGLPVLALHAGATRAAQQRAGEIETAFSHTRPDGSNFTTALTAAGVTYRAEGKPPLLQFDLQFVRLILESYPFSIALCLMSLSSESASRGVK